MDGNFVMDMLIPERLFYVRRLSAEIEEQNKRHKEAMQQAKMKSASARAGRGRRR